MRQKRLVNIIIVSLSCIIIGLIFLLAYNGICISNPSDVNTEDTSKSALIIALESYYGEWEIVEDFGYHGIHRQTEVDEFDIGKSIFFQEEFFSYEDIINAPYPSIKIEITSSAEMQQIDRMEYPHEMGFDNPSAKYSKIILTDHSQHLSCSYNLYILNDNEIILEGDVHHYYRAVKKN